MTYTFIFQKREMITVEYNKYGVPEVVSSRPATLEEIGTPWASTYNGCPDTPIGPERVSAVDWGHGDQVWVGHLTVDEFRKQCRDQRIAAYRQMKEVDLCKSQMEPIRMPHNNYAVKSNRPLMNSTARALSG